VGGKGRGPTSKEGTGSVGEGREREGRRKRGREGPPPRVGWHPSHVPNPEKYPAKLRTQIRLSAPSSVISINFSRPTCFSSSLRCWWQVGSAPFVRRYSDCLASSAPFTSIRLTYLLTYLLYSVLGTSLLWRSTVALTYLKVKSASAFVYYFLWSWFWSWSCYFGLKNYFGLVYIIRPTEQRLCCCRKWNFIPWIC